MNGGPGIEPGGWGAHPDIGMPDNLSDVYLALMGDARTARGVADLLGEDVSVVGDLLVHMQSLGLARSLEGGRWEALSPNPAAAGVIARLDQQIAARRRSKDVVRQGFASLQQIYEQHRSARSSADVEVLKDPADVRTRLAELAMLTQDEVLAMHPTMAPPEALEQGLELDRDLLTRQVEYKVLWPHTARRQRSTYGYFEALVELGAQIRTADVIPARVLVLDRQHALVALDAHEGAALVSQPVFVDFLVGLFDRCWDVARPVAMESLTHEALEDIEVTILVEMARGRTDDAIARRLNVSTRTVRRYVSQLSERLNVETRFQLGLAALRMGVLDDELPHVAQSGSLYGAALPTDATGVLEDLGEGTRGQHEPEE